jgi:hypothetical protein
VLAHTSLFRCLLSPHRHAAHHIELERPLFP